MNNVLSSPTVSPNTGRAPLAPSWGRLLLKKQLIVLALLVAVRGIIVYAVPDEVESAAKVTNLTLPTRIDSWKGKDVKVDPFVYEVLHPEAVLQKRYTLQSTGTSAASENGRASRPAEVEVLAMYTRDTEGFHPPDVCMTAQGWIISEHTQRQVSARGKSLTLEVITGEQREQKKLLAYCFTDPSGAISGRTVTFANMILAKAFRRRVGTVELQYAYDRRSLLPNGDFSPQLKDLMLKTAETVHRQLGAATKATS